jgi:L-threonylcarbamoyladenylate synthase
MKDVIDEVVKVLRRGGIVCFPTETYYGLAVDALDAAAVGRLVEAKGRDGKPIATIVSGLEVAARLWRETPRAVVELARARWPGPLTIVAPARPEVPRALVGDSGGVGARVSSHPLAQTLASVFGGPITATSANRAGQPPARTIDEARRQLGASVDHYLDGGDTPGGEPSTVVEVDSDGGVRVIRAGAVTIG